MKQAIKRALRRTPRLYRTLSRASAKARELRRGLARLMKQGSYMSRNYLVDDERRLIYLSNAKVASTSIKASIRGLRGGDNYREIIDAVAKDERYLSDIDLRSYPDYFTFTFVRAPFRRLVSCYLNKYHTDNQLLGMAGHGLYEKDGYFDHYLLGFLARDRGFKRFARRVCLIPDCLSDRHFVGQQFMLRIGDRSLAQFVGKMEDLPEAYEPIRAKYDLMPLPQHNKTDGGNGWMDMYDLDTARRVARRYRDDIEAFGYQASWDALIAHLEQKEGRR